MDWQWLWKETAKKTSVLGKTTYMGELPGMTTGTLNPQILVFLSYAEIAAVHGGS